MNDGEKREVAVELSVPQTEEEETVHKQSTTILEQVRIISRLTVLLERAVTSMPPLIPAGSLSR